MNTYTNTPANIENTNARNNSAQVNNKIDDFGAKIGGARKDLYQAANEWAAKLAGITPEALTKAGGVSKLLHLPNLEKMTEAGVITADQARAALIVWRGIERKPQGIYRADRWAERTRARLEAVADILTGTEPTAEDVADIITAARESAEFAVITAAEWPAVPFTFGAYSVKRSTYSTPAAFRIIGGGYYRGTASTDPADIAAQLREMTAADAEKAADRRAAGPRLGVYHTSDFTRYFIAVEGKCEIVLKVCDTYQEATEAARTERAALLERYEALKSFPALRRSWNRPRVGKEWHAEDVTPEQFAAVLPFKGVEFGNWLNQQERAALLNSAFDGFHDLADLLGIPAAAVTLGGRLSFSFATRGHANSAAHFDSCYNTINLNKRNGAGCMAHEWLHACDHYAAELAGRGGCGSWGAAFSTEYKGEPLAATDAAARRLIDAIRNTDFFTRSGNYQAITGKMQGGESYYTMPCELAARGFEGVVLYLLTKAGACSDFLVNLQGWQDFERDDAGHRRDCYPYPSDAEAAALLPYYIDFFRALFGRCEVSKEAAEGVAAATLQAQQEKAEADRAAAEKAAKEKAESEARRAAQREQWEREAAERRAEQERKAEERKQAAAHTVEMLREVLTARHCDAIATAYDAAAVYAVAHLEGEIYTLSADIETANREGRAYIENRPAARIQYKRVHNAKRVICRRWQVPEIRASKWNARELVESLTMTDTREICRAFDTFERAETWAKAAELWDATQRDKAEQAARAAAASEHTEKAAGPAKASSNTETAAPAAGLHLIDTADGVAVIGDDWKDTYFNKKVIKTHGAKWNKEAKQWEATDPADVARLRAWFALRHEEQAEGEAVTETPAAATLYEAGEISESREFADGVRVIVSGYERAKYGKECGTVNGYDPTTGKYWVIFRSGHGDGNSWHAADELEHLPEWVTEGSQVYNLNGWHTGDPFTISNARAEVVTMTTADGFRFECDPVELVNEYAPHYSELPKSETPAEPEPLAVAASYDTDEPETPAEQNRDGLPEWLHVGTRFCLLDFVTGKPTAVRYTCAAIDYEAKTVTIPEARDSFRNGSTVYRWDAFHWSTFAPITDDTDPTPDPSGEGVGICHSYETAEPEPHTESTATPSRCHLYAFSFAERCPKWATSFRNEEEAAKWLRKTADGVGGLLIEAADILKAAPDCLIWYSNRSGSYNCQYVADEEGKPLHGTIADYRALLLYYRKRHILEHVANDIRKAVEMGCTFVVSTADHRARVEVKRDDENGIYIASWYVGDERDSTRAHLHAIEAAEMVYTFREGYAYDLEDIQTSHKKTA